MLSMLRMLTCILVTGLLTGCLGVYDNRGVFTPPPQVGMKESDMLHAYGAPSWTGEVDGNTVYIYKVRNNSYIILVGIYDGFDYVLTVDDGEILTVGTAPRAKAMAIMNPMPWAEVE